MTLYTPAPLLRPFGEDKPTLLVSWWITIFATIIIALRLAGRYVRVEKLWAEDKVAACSLIPLYMRMACVHVVLLYGTNNVQLPRGLQFTREEIHRRSIGSGLVLFSRILYPATLWILKYVSLHFFSRLIKATGKRRYYYTLMFVRVSLGITFLAVIISNLAECRPFHAYWQVTPDPGPQCRQGVASLLTMAVCNTFTDLLLVVFPVPIILSSKIKTSRKAFLVLLFSLGLSAVIVSSYRVPKVLDENGYQGTRTTWASIEILVGTIVANTQVLGSFIRDTGVKKARFRPGYEHNSHSGTNSKGAGGLSSFQNNNTNNMTLMSHKDNWGDEVDERGGVTGMGMSTTIKAQSSMDTDFSKSPSGRASEDSLIPKGSHHHSSNSLSQSNLSGVTAVVRTTRIEVTVEDADTGSGRQMTPTPPKPPKPPMQVRSASVRGTGRGSTKVLQQVDAPLPGGLSPPSRGGLNS
ncbi:hypothetical protein QBC37DRAFT_191371 [Rhypophila decipiens]|uniref:Rhodopsin domain-containing protein n=1 Tax=Rhypophila decipiens TaxID=261697 RepID=A0AAN7B6E5_9PEZI|nr:hypothetical protein QBC37DRAFT_191371 [Rhypophila decipiens]